MEQFLCLLGRCSMRCPGEEGLSVLFCSGVGYIATLSMNSSWGSSHSPCLGCEVYQVIFSTCLWWEGNIPLLCYWHCAKNDNVHIFSRRTMTVCARHNCSLKTDVSKTTSVLNKSLTMTWAHTAPYQRVLVVINNRWSRKFWTLLEGTYSISVPQINPWCMHLCKTDPEAQRE